MIILIILIIIFLLNIRNEKILKININFEKIILIKCSLIARNAIKKNLNKDNY